ncbi:MAG TPA: HlyD family efflux transporter periplasmic adaptor subunit [Caldilinea sp.]|nr:HlyD family efflux transporter periplasmic adaptor subunit [Caldilinea sp.]
MRRIIIILLIIGGVSAAGWWGYNYYTEQQAAEEQAAEAAAAAAEQELEQVIWASGKLTPVSWANVGPATSGTVAAIHVESGDWVSAGDLLLDLEHGVLQGQVAAAEAAVSEALAALAKLKAGATAADIAAAEAAVAAAKAQVAVAGAALLEVQSAVDGANAQVSMAQAQYAEVASHPTEQEQIAARAVIAQAEAALRNAQAAYNLVKDDPQVGSLPQSLALMQATSNLEAANAQQAAILQGPTQAQLAVAARAIDAARVGVTAAENRAPGAEANVRAAMAAVDSAEAALNKLREGATVEDIAMAEARVASARAALTSATAQLRLTQVTAPFDGQVGLVNVRAGETVNPGDPTVLLGDTHKMHVETTDLRETDVVNVREGQTVEVTFDALPDRIFDGTVTSVAPVSSAEQGSTNYTVDVDVADLDPALRWGMTAFVNIRPE